MYFYLLKPYCKFDHRRLLSSYEFRLQMLGPGINGTSNDAVIGARYQSKLTEYPCKIMTLPKCVC